MMTEEHKGWNCANDIHNSLLVTEVNVSQLIDACEAFDFSSTEEMLTSVHDEACKFAVAFLTIAGACRVDLERRGIAVPLRTAA